MAKKGFDVSYWEDVWANVPIPQETKAEHIHEIHHILTTILPIGNLKLIEIGCAPGSWLIYFHNCFNYSVSWIEYASRAYEKTIDNLKIKNIQEEIFQGDFLSLHMNLMVLFFRQVSLSILKM